MNIKAVTKKDLPAIVSLMTEFAAHEGLSQYCEITVERLRTAMFGDGAFVEGLIATSGDDHAGYALYYQSFSSFRGHRGLYLEDIYIKQEFRSRGLGSKMLTAIAKIADKRGFDRIDLTVLCANEPAISFYKKLGATLDTDGCHGKFTDQAFRSLAS